MKMPKVICRSCGHPRSPKIVDPTGRCNNCRADIQRRWDYRKEDQGFNWNDVKAKRNLLVSEAQWAVLPGSPLSAECQALFLEYIKSLHRVTVDFEDPNSVEWPTQPLIEYA